MTRDEILAMKPGAELDALVAEKVMRLPASIHSLAKPPYGDYSRNWLAMGVVVEAMREKGYGIILKNKGAIEFWRCYLCVNSPAGLSGQLEWSPGTITEAPTAPEAVCKAALLALLEKE